MLVVMVLKKRCQLSELSKVEFLVPGYVYTNVGWGGKEKVVPISVTISGWLLRVGKGNVNS